MRAALYCNLTVLDVRQRGTKATNVRTSIAFWNLEVVVS